MLNMGRFFIFSRQFRQGIACDANYLFVLPDGLWWWLASRKNRLFTSGLGRQG